MSDSSKIVHVVAPLVALLVVGGVVAYLLLRARKPTLQPPLVSNALATSGIVTCSGVQPSVNTTTGAVTNYSNLLMPDQVTCGENTRTLSDLCLQTKCTSDACTRSGVNNPSWDTYNPVTHACTKVANPSCEQQACDADYCNSDTVVTNLPPLHKFSNSINGQTTCLNPSEADVAALCNAQPGKQWTYPECMNVQVATDLVITITTSTTRQISGTISRPYTTDVNDVSLSYTYSLSGISQSIGGALSTSPSGACETGVTNMCLAFNIYAWPALPPGPYTLTIAARPSWSTVFTHTSAAPLSINLVYVAPPAGVYPALNPAPSRAVAVNAATDPVWLKARLQETARLYFDAGITVPATLNLLQLPEENGVPGLFFACKPDIVPLEANALMPYKLLLFKWPAPASIPSCSSALRYDVLRARADGVGATDTVMYGNSQPQVLDLVRVGDTWNYTFRAYQGTSYATAACKSQEVVITVTVAPYTDATCHTVPAPQPGSLPPWMWATPLGCAWNASNQSAADYYCAFEDGKTTPSFNPATLRLYSPAANTCATVQRSNPVIDTVWSKKYCDPSEASCFDGEKDENSRVVVCNTALQLGSTSSTIDNNVAFAQRLGNLVQYYDAHNVHPELDEKVASIRSTTDQLNLYGSEYFKCGPSTQPDTWGTDPAACVDPVTGLTDTACAAVAASADCLDRNICNPWTNIGGDGRRFLFGQTRTCYVNPELQSQCCTAGTYVYNKALPRRGACSSNA